MILAKEELATRKAACAQDMNPAQCEKIAELMMRDKERTIWLVATALAGIGVGALGMHLMMGRR